MILCAYHNSSNQMVRNEEGAYSSIPFRNITDSSSLAVA